MGKYELDVLVSQEGGIQVVTILGPVDSDTLPGFKAKLDPICEAPGATVLLDCEGLTYLNSRSIGRLRKYPRNLLPTRGRLVLCQLNEKLMRTLERLEISKAVSFYATLEEARAALKATA